MEHVIPKENKLS